MHLLKALFGFDKKFLMQSDCVEKRENCSTHKYPATDTMSVTFLLVPHVEFLGVKQF